MGKPEINPMGRLEIVLQRYDSGLLCKCFEIEEEEIDDPVHGLVYKKVLKHSEDCKAKETARELLDYP